jgi:hypothetical protein
MVVRFLILSAALCLCLAFPAAAQTLRGLKIVELASDVSAPARDEDLRDCRVDTERLKAAAGFAFGESSVKVAARPQATYLVHVVVIGNRPSPDKVVGCSVFIDATLVTAIRGVTYWGSEVREGDVWRGTYALMAPANQLTAQAAEAVVYITRSFIADWAKDN